MGKSETMEWSAMTWPDRPLCHGEKPRFTRTHPSWRVPDPRAEARPRNHEDEPRRPEGMPDSPYGQPFRTCSYCGSIHPEDLYTFLMLPKREGPCRACNGPGPEPDKSDIIAWMNWSRASYLNTHSCRVTLHGADWKYGWPHKFYVEGIENPIAGVPVISSSTSYFDEAKGRHVTELGEPYPAPQFTHAKFYNEHLLDCDDEAFAALIPLLDREGGIRFERRTEGLFYTKTR